jgi:hypothetical protein
MMRLTSSVVRSCGCISLLVFCALMYGCAAPTRITTNRDANYQAEPKRLVVLANVSAGFGREFANVFNTKMISIAKTCGAEMEISEPSGLELDKNVHFDRMKAFNADSLLVMRRAGGTVMQSGALIQAIYDVELVSVTDNRTVWRASVSFNRGGTALPVTLRAEVLAIDITNALKLDKVFKSCAVISTENSPAVIDRRQSGAQPRLESSESPALKRQIRSTNMDDLKDLIPPQ